MHFYIPVRHFVFFTIQSAYNDSISDALYFLRYKLPTMIQPQNL